MRKNAYLYVTAVLTFGVAITLIFHLAPRWVGRSAGAAPAFAIHPGQTEAFLSEWLRNMRDPLAVLLLQLVSVLSVAWAAAAVCKRLNQSAVIGEMAAGIVLGPSVLGHFLPHWQAALFPPGSLGALKTLSEIGVIVFMFVIGAELDGAQLRRSAQSTVFVSHVSILFPFLLGVVLALALFDRAPAHVPFITFALFMGIAMSITAFPVLARICRDRNIDVTPLGMTAITCAAIDDVTAWCILAVVLALLRAGGWIGPAITVLLAFGYSVFMVGFVKPSIERRWTGKAAQASSCRDGKLVAVTVLYLFCSALITDIIGIHAIFGAFLAGVTLSNQPGVRQFVHEKIEPFCVAALLPLFFAFSGLRTEIGLINDLQGWVTCGLIVLLATVGKLGGSTVAARATGMPWRVALPLGALMNTRGLMELVVLNIGYDLGVIPPAVFTMMVVMALVTTLMTGPLLSLFQSLPVYSVQEGGA